MLIRHFDLHCGNFLISLLVEEDFFEFLASKTKIFPTIVYKTYKMIGTAT